MRYAIVCYFTETTKRGYVDRCEDVLEDDGRFLLIACTPVQETYFMLRFDMTRWFDDEKKARQIWKHTEPRRSVFTVSHAELIAKEIIDK